MFSWIHLVNDTHFYGVASNEHGFHNNGERLYKLNQCSIMKEVDVTTSVAFTLFQKSSSKFKVLNSVLYLVWCPFDSTQVIAYCGVIKFDLDLNLLSKKYFNHFPV